MSCNQDSKLLKENFVELLLSILYLFYFYFYFLYLFYFYFYIYVCLLLGGLFFIFMVLGRQFDICL